MFSTKKDLPHDVLKTVTPGKEVLSNFITDAKVTSVIDEPSRLPDDLIDEKWINLNRKTHISLPDLDLHIQNDTLNSTLGVGVIPHYTSGRVLDLLLALCCTKESGENMHLYSKCVRGVTQFFTVQCQKATTAEEFLGVVQALLWHVWTLPTQLVLPVHLFPHKVLTEELARCVCKHLRSWYISGSAVVQQHCTKTLQAFREIAHHRKEYMTLNAFQQIQISSFQNNKSTDENIQRTGGKHSKAIPRLFTVSVRCMPYKI